MGNSIGQPSHMSRKAPVIHRKGTPLGTCKQRNTGQGHLEKDTGRWWEEWAIFGNFWKSQLF